MTKRTFIIVIFMAFILVPGGFARASTQQAAADWLVQAGEYALRGGDIQTAIHEFSKALLINPDHRKAKAYLSTYNLKEGIYSQPRIKEAQMSDMARDIRDFKDYVAFLKKKRHDLEQRVMLLEDVIERKGDHKLLKNIEDYYRQNAMYEVDTTLPPQEQLVSLHQKHKDFQEYAFDKDRVQEKYVDVMEELLEYREDHLQDARNDVVEYQIALAQNRKELLFRMEQVKRLRNEFDLYRYNRYYDANEVRLLQKDYDEANDQVNTLLRQRRVLLNRLHGHVDGIREAL